MAISRRTAQLHCRTCLSDLLGGEAYDMEDNPELITWLERLLPLVSLYRGEEQADYPHFVCTACFGKLNEFNAFYTNVCTATDVLDRIFDDMSASRTATAGHGAPVKEEYTNGTGDATTLEIEVVDQATDGESTDTCSETDDRLYAAAKAASASASAQQLQQAQQQQQQVPLQLQTNVNGKVREYEHVNATSHTQVQPKSESTNTTIEYIVPPSGLPPAINRKSYKCSKCERKFLDKYSCIMHIRSCQLLGHTEECYECEICHKNYQKIGHLNRHKLTEHADLCTLKCEYAGCNFIFRRSAFRQRHYEMFHVNEAKKRQPSLTAAEANATVVVDGGGGGGGVSDAAATLDESRRAVQSLLQDSNSANVANTATADTLTANDEYDEPSVMLEMVDDEEIDHVYDGAEEHDNDNAEDDDLLEEMVMAPTTKPYRGTCPICYETFNLGKDLRTHISSVHPGALKFKCGQCERRFLYQSYLNTHVAAAHGERNTPCTFCPKLFKTNAELKRHISHVHHGLRPFGCRHCTAKFGVRASRDRHELTHSGERPFMCHLCGRSFNYAHSVRKHMESHQHGRLKQAGV